MNWWWCSVVMLLLLATSRYQSVVVTQTSNSQHGFLHAQVDLLMRPRCWKIPIGTLLFSYPRIMGGARGIQVYSNEYPRFSAKISLDVLLVI
jgi:hypothetical protein